MKGIKQTKHCDKFMGSNNMATIVQHLACFGTFVLGDNVM